MEIIPTIRVAVMVCGRRARRWLAVGKDESGVMLRFKYPCGRFRAWTLEGEEMYVLSLEMSDVFWVVVKEVVVKKVVSRSVEVSS